MTLKQAKNKVLLYLKDRGDSPVDDVRQTMHNEGVEGGLVMEVIDVLSTEEKIYWCINDETGEIWLYLNI